MEGVRDREYLRWRLLDSVLTGIFTGDIEVLGPQLPNPRKGLFGRLTRACGDSWSRDGLLSC